MTLVYFRRGGYFGSRSRPKLWAAIDCPIGSGFAYQHVSSRTVGTKDNKAIALSGNCSKPKVPMWQSENKLKANN